MESLKLYLNLVIRCKGFLKIFLFISPSQKNKVDGKLKEPGAS